MSVGADRCSPNLLKGNRKPQPSCINMTASIEPDSKRVVVVAEDELLVRMFACAILTGAGYDVVEAKHAEEALAVLEDRAPDVHALFTDVHMPGSMDGLALAHLTLLRWPWLALLIASGRARPDPEHLPRGSRFLPKPYEPHHLIGHLREMLGA